MLETEFERIAKGVGATLTIQDENLDISGGIRSPNLVFDLTLSYKNRIINIRNSTGTYFAGRVSSKITKPSESLEFEVTTRSHFSSLFKRNKDRFKLKTKNINIDSFLKHSTGFAELCAIAKDTVFEPTILGQNTDDDFELITEYHLQFSSWWEVIKPIIQFYKEFIDKFERNAIK
jgi:hypothetical protein